jgi:predicted aminopeptidase
MLCHPVCAGDPMPQQYHRQLSPSLQRLNPFARLQPFALLLCLLPGGCSTIDYYYQVSSGHLQLMQQREPIEQVIADPAQDPQLRQRLELLLEAREFASSQLSLPDNGSYRVYADIQRPVLMWNVFVTPEFSLEPQLHCFPVAGCVVYRGYYDLNRARGSAALARQAGMDSWVGGVEAYSTLGWFDDPILSSMLRSDDHQLVALIFHELAHQQLYLPGDSTFSESFASFVEQQGLREWLVDNGLSPPDSRKTCWHQTFTALVGETRTRLQALYARDLPAEQMAEGKQAEFERLHKEYRQLLDRSGGLDTAGHDAWMQGPPNNAKLLPFELYRKWLPAFAELFRQAGADWPEFYRRAALLAGLPSAARVEQLEALNAAAPGPPVCKL